MFIPVISMKNLLYWMVSFVLERAVCMWGGFLLYRWLFCIHHGWQINIIDSCSKYPVCRARLLNGVSQIMHQRLSNWKQVSGECAFPSRLCSALREQEVLISFAWRASGTWCLGTCAWERWLFSSPQNRILLTLINYILVSTWNGVPCSKTVCIGGLRRKIGNYWDM